MLEEIIKEIVKENISKFRRKATGREVLPFIVQLLLRNKRMSKDRIVGYLCCYYRITVSNARKIIYDYEQREIIRKSLNLLDMRRVYYTLPTIITG